MSCSDYDLDEAWRDAERLPGRPSIADLPKDVIGLGESEIVEVCPEAERGAKDAPGISYGFLSDRGITAKDHMTDIMGVEEPSGSGRQFAFIEETGKARAVFL